jgi:hypothetical protein
MYCTMYHLPRACLRLCVVLSTGLILAIGCNAAAASENCERLVALSHQYASVELTSAQKQLKRKLVTWYTENCTRQARR